MTATARSDHATLINVNTLANLKLIPTGAAVGAEVQGLNLALPIPEEVKQALKQAWAKHLVL